MTTPHRRATGPTRTAIVEALSGSAEGMTAAELAGALDRHPNAIRKQLRSLVADGTIGAEREVSGRRGRPAVRYRAAQERRDTTANRRLAAMLVALVAEAGAEAAQVEEFGRRQGATLAPGPDGRAALLDLLTTMGFAPSVATGAADARAGRLEVVLGHCPFAEAVNAGGGDLVCVLHRGISRGLVERSPSARLTGFDIHPPERAGCRIRAEGLRPVAAS